MKEQRRSPAKAGVRARADEERRRVGEHLRRAYRANPANLMAVRQLGRHLEGEGATVTALQLYLDHVGTWDRVFELRYQVAALLGMSRDWIDQIQGSSTQDCERLAEAMERRADILGSPSYQKAAQVLCTSDRAELPALLLDAADCEWRELAHFVSLRAVARRVVGVLRHHDLGYQRLLLTPSVRRGVVPTVQAGALVTRIIRLAPRPGPVRSPFGNGSDPSALRTGEAHAISRDLRRLALRPRLDPRARYAIACGYSRLWQVAGAPAHAEASVDLLQSLTEFRQSFDLSRYVADDPDLAPVRCTKVFHEWWRTNAAPGLGGVDAHHWDLYRWLQILAREGEAHWQLKASLSAREEPDRLLPAVLDAINCVATSREFANAKQCERKIRQEAASCGVRLDEAPTGNLHAQMPCLSQVIGAALAPEAKGDQVDASGTDDLITNFSDLCGRVTSTRSSSPTRHRTHWATLGALLNAAQSDDSRRTGS